MSPPIGTIAGILYELDHRVSISRYVCDPSYTVRGHGIVSNFKADSTEYYLVELGFVFLLQIVALNGLQGAVYEVRIEEYRMLALSSNEGEIAVSARRYEHARQVVMDLITTQDLASRPIYSHYLANWRSYRQLERHPGSTSA